MNVIPDIKQLYEQHREALLHAVWRFNKQPKKKE